MIEVFAFAGSSSQTTMDATEENRMEASSTICPVVLQQVIAKFNIDIGINV